MGKDDSNCKFWLEKINTSSVSLIWEASHLHMEPIELFNCAN